MNYIVKPAGTGKGHVHLYNKDTATFGQMVGTVRKLFVPSKEGEDKTNETGWAAVPRFGEPETEYFDDYESACQYVLNQYIALGR